MMPIYSVHTEAQLDDLHPTLTELYIDNAMINVCNLHHSEENCREDSNYVLSGQHPHLHVIFINAILEAKMRNIINQLIQQYPLEEEDEDEPNNHIQCIMMCPGCGTPFSHQHIRNCRSA